MHKNNVVCQNNRLYHYSELTILKYTDIFMWMSFAAREGDRFCISQSKSCVGQALKLIDGQDCTALAWPGRTLRINTFQGGVNKCFLCLKIPNIGIVFQYIKTTQPASYLDVFGEPCFRFYSIVLYVFHTVDLVTKFRVPPLTMWQSYECVVVINSFWSIWWKSADMLRRNIIEKKLNVLNVLRQQQWNWRCRFVDWKMICLVAVAQRHVFQCIYDQYLTLFSVQWYMYIYIYIYIIYLMLSSILQLRSTKVISKFLF